MILELGGWIFNDSGAGRLDFQQIWSWEAGFSAILELGGWILLRWYQVVQSKIELSLQRGTGFCEVSEVQGQGIRSDGRGDGRGIWAEY